MNVQNKFYVFNHGNGHILYFNKGVHVNFKGEVEIFLPEYFTMIFPDTSSTCASEICKEFKEFKDSPLLLLNFLENISTADNSLKYEIIKSIKGQSNSINLLEHFITYWHRSFQNGYPNNLNFFLGGLLVIFQLIKNNLIEECKIHFQECFEYGSKKIITQDYNFVDDSFVDSIDIHNFTSAMNLLGYKYRSLTNKLDFYSEVFDNSSSFISENGNLFIGELKDMLKIYLNNLINSKYSFLNINEQIEWIVNIKQYKYFTNLDIQRLDHCTKLINRPVNDNVISLKKSDVKIAYTNTNKNQIVCFNNYNYKFLKLIINETDVDDLILLHDPLNILTCNSYTFENIKKINREIVLSNKKRFPLLSFTHAKEYPKYIKEGESLYYLVFFSGTKIQQYNGKHQIRMNGVSVNIDKDLIRKLNDMDNNLYRGVVLIQAIKLSKEVVSYYAIYLTNEISNNYKYKKLKKSNKKIAELDLLVPY